MSEWNPGVGGVWVVTTPLVFGVLALMRGK
jgi:hypothetical protein